MELARADENVDRRRREFATLLRIHFVMGTQGGEIRR
jgi:hypothetical protein